MTKEIVWTISYGKAGMVLRTKNMRCDEEDKEITTPSVALILSMKRLSDKYCKRGYSVLFDLDC